MYIFSALPFTCFELGSTAYAFPCVFSSEDQRAARHLLRIQTGTDLWLLRKIFYFLFSSQFYNEHAFLAWRGACLLRSGQHSLFLCA